MPVYFIFNGLHHKPFVYGFVVCDGKMAFSVIRINLHNLAIFFFVLRLSKVEINIAYNYFTVYIKNRSKQEIKF